MIPAKYERHREASRVRAWVTRLGRDPEFRVAVLACAIWLLLVQANPPWQRSSSHRFLEEVTLLFWRIGFNATHSGPLAVVIGLAAIVLLCYALGWVIRGFGRPETSSTCEGDGLTFGGGLGHGEAETGALTPKDGPKELKRAALSKPVRQELENTVMTGAKLILDGAIEFPDWVDHMLQDSGDRVSWIAERTNQTTDASLWQIYSYAVRVAHLLQTDRLLVSRALITEYRIEVEKQFEREETVGAGRLARPEPTRDDFRELCRHPAVYQKTLPPMASFGFAIMVFLVFLFADPSAFASNPFAIGSLIAVGFLVFKGALIAKTWMQERGRRKASATRQSLES